MPTFTETRSGLIVPVEKRPAAAKCRICGTTFAKEQLYEGGPYERHVLACFDRNEQELAEQSLKHKMPELYGDEAFDPEAEHFMRENARAILEGRKRI